MKHLTKLLTIISVVFMTITALAATPPIIDENTRGDVTLTANWTANKYSVKFNANGGTGTMSDEVFVYDTAKALTANAFTRTGYTFLGWSTDKSATTAVYTDKESVKNLTSANNGTVTLYAVWKINQYNIDLNIIVDGTGNSYGRDPVTGKNAVSIDAYSGNPLTKIYSGIADYCKNSDYNTPYKFVITPKTGYTFSDGTTAAKTYEGTVPANDMLITPALKRVQYTITYTLNGGTVSGNPTSYNISTDDITLNNPTRTGYTFQYWTLDGDATNKQYTSKTVAVAQKSTGNKKFVAHWKPYTLTITVNTNGGTAVHWDDRPNPYVLSYDDTTQPAGEKASLSSAGLYDTAAFAEAPEGYHDTNTFTIESTTGGTISGEKGFDTAQDIAKALGYPITSKNQSVTLYPVWTANSYTVKFNANGGSGTMADETFTYDVAKDLTTNAFTKNGYTFSHWNTKADDTGTRYEDGQSIKNLSNLQNGTISLYAFYTPGMEGNAYDRKTLNWIAPKSGYYKLECWGAQGTGWGDVPGGKGGYSYGTMYIKEGDGLYISVGAANLRADDGSADHQYTNGAGGAGTIATPMGGGAASIEKTLIGDGQLKNYVNNKSDVLIVAGGGGASEWHTAGDLYAPNGGVGGGTTGGTAKAVIGGGEISQNLNKHLATGGTQTSGGVSTPIGGGNSTTAGYYMVNGSFGQGGYQVGGDGGGSGGGGWYGGGGASYAGGGGGGSGYVSPELINAATIAGDQSFPSPNGGTEVGHSGAAFAQIKYIGPTL